MCAHPPFFFFFEPALTSVVFEFQRGHCGLAAGCSEIPFFGHLAGNLAQIVSQIRV